MNDDNTVDRLTALATRIELQLDRNAEIAEAHAARTLTGLEVLRTNAHKLSAALDRLEDKYLLSKMAL